MKIWVPIRVSQHHKLGTESAKFFCHKMTTKEGVADHVGAKRKLCASWREFLDGLISDELE